MKRICDEQDFGQKPGCGLFYDDAEKRTICPHEELNPVRSPVEIFTVILLMDKLWKEWTRDQDWSSFIHRKFET